MLDTTKNCVSAILKADPSITAEERVRIMAAMRQAPRREPAKPSAPRILRRAEVAELFGRSTRFVDQLAAQGRISKVRIQGRRRALGFRSSDVDNLIAGGI